MTIRIESGDALAGIPGWPSSGFPAAGPERIPSYVEAGLLPSLREIYQDNALMVGFGPRITGSRAHDDFIGWLHEQFQRNGCDVLPYAYSPCNLWEALSWGVSVLDGRLAGDVPVAAYYPRGGETPDEGLVGRLVDVETAAAAGVDLADPAAVAGWLAEVTGEPAAGDPAAPYFLLIDSHLPEVGSRADLDAETGVFHRQPGDDDTPWKTLWDRKLWKAVAAAPGARAAAGVVCVVDASYQALEGNYVPPLAGYLGIPALYVDREAGTRLRRAATTAPRIRFTMTARRTATRTPSIVAVLPGDGGTDRTLICNTHSDGTNFVEENGAVALVEIARYLNALRLRGRGLRHTVVFSAVTGHFNGDPARFPETEGFIADHPDLVGRATAALTLEHLGVTEWLDDEQGYRTTGLPDWGVMWVDERLEKLAVERFDHYDLPNHRLARRDAPMYAGVGKAFADIDLPALSFLSAPTYLLTTPVNGCLDKLDPALMRRQMTWFIDLLHRLDAQP